MQPLTWSPTLFETIKISKLLDAQKLADFVEKSLSKESEQSEEKVVNGNWF